jgi:hypothetical protein
MYNQSVARRMGWVKLVNTLLRQRITKTLIFAAAIEIKL